VSTFYTKKANVADEVADKSEKCKSAHKWAEVTKNLFALFAPSSYTEKVSLI